MEEQLTLYLELEPGQKADLEVVGLAAAAFAEAVKEIAYILEPGLDISLEFDSGTEGSLKLNAILKTWRPLVPRKMLYVIVATVVGWLANDARSYFVGKALDGVFVDEEASSLSQEDVLRIARAVKDILDGKIAKEPSRQLFQQLERDEKIKSVGATHLPNQVPSSPIPRSEFANRANIVETTERELRTRIVQSTERLTLISPVLLNADRIWRFRSVLGEFGYLMKDQVFLGRLLSGRQKLPMKAGIQITAVVDTHESFEGAIWVPKQRQIISVLRVHRKPSDPDLFSPSNQRKRRK